MPAKAAEKYAWILNSRQELAGGLVVVDAAPVHGSAGVIGVILVRRPAQRLVQLELEDGGHEPAETEGSC